MLLPFLFTAICIFSCMCDTLKFNWFTTTHSLSFQFNLKFKFIFFLWWWWWWSTFLFFFWFRNIKKNISFKCVYVYDIWWHEFYSLYSLKSFMMSECCFILLICFSHEYCNSFCMSTFATLKMFFFSIYYYLYLSIYIDIIRTGQKLSFHFK